jgi:photosystem II stability/assembly factor-like uncharacterized protein
MKNCLPVLLSFFFFTSILFSQTIEWQQLNGPFGGTALCFASNSNGDLFAGADQNQQGVFKSTDDGVIWFPKSNGISLADRAISWITFDDSGYVIIGTNSHIGSRVYKSKDNGESWFETENMGGTSVATNDSGHIYVGNTAYAQYSVSKDCGYTWIHYPSPAAFTNCITINDSGHIFIGGNYTGYRSTDNGVNWTTLSLPDGINSFGFAPNGDVYAGCSREYASNSGVYKSTDNGDSWTVVKEGFRVYPSHNIVINNVGDIFVGSYGWGIWKSTDNGDTWTQNNLGLEHLYVKAMHIDNNGNIFAGLSGGGIYRSTDNGETWQQFGLTVAGVKKIAINPTNGYMFAAVSGVSRSTDNGQFWQPINNGLSNLEVKEVTIKNDGTIFLGCGINGPCIFRSTDNGNSWTAIENEIQRHDVEAITIDDAGNIYAGNYYGVYKSTNDGDNWVNIGGVGGAKGLEFNSQGDLFLASYGQGFWKLPAGDTTWVNLTSNINSSWIYSLFISSNDYLYTDQARSTDNGLTWTNMPLGNMAYSYAENSQGHLFAGTFNYGSGVKRSTDYGVTWESINSGLPTMDIRSIAVDSEDYLYAGPWGYSLFKTTTPTVTSADNEKQMPSYFSLEQNYPNPFNPSTVIGYQLPVSSDITLKVYDILGNEIATLVDEYKPAGKYEVDFGIHSDEGRNLPACRQGLSSGIYFYQLKIGGPEINSGQGMIQTKKMILIK